MFSSPPPFSKFDRTILSRLKKEAGEGLHAQGEEESARRVLFFSFPPSPPKMIGNLKLLFVSGGKQGGLAHFFEAPPAFTRLNKRCFHDNSAHPLASPLRIPRIPKNPCSLISSNSLAWVDKWVSWQIVIADPFLAPSPPFQVLKPFPFSWRRFGEWIFVPIPDFHNLQSKRVSDFVIFE